MTIETRSISIETRALKAALLFAAKNDITRAYLCGVLVEHVAEHVRLVATDGHRLICVRVGDDAALGEASAYRYVIARDVLESALKLNKKAPQINCEWSRETYPDPARPGVTCVKSARVTIGGIVTGDLQETCGGKYPEYERIIPRKYSGERAHYNAAYLNDCGKARDYLVGNGTSFCVEIAHNGTSPGLVELRDDAFAIVMPFRGSTIGPSLPEWFTGPVAAEDVAA